MIANAASAILNVHHFPVPIPEGPWTRCDVCGYPCDAESHRAQPITLHAVRAEYGEPATRRAG